MKRHSPAPTVSSPSSSALLSSLLLCIFTFILLPSTIAATTTTTTTASRAKQRPPATTFSSSSSSTTSCFLPPPLSYSSSPFLSSSTTTTTTTYTRVDVTTAAAPPRRRSIVVTWAKKKTKQEEEMKRLAAMEAKKKQKKTSTSKKPRTPVFTARIVILGSPSEQWGQGVREGLLREGWMEDRVQLLPIPRPEDYIEVKWMAYLREGLKLRNSTFVIAAPAAAGQVMRFLEKHPLRGTILLAPPGEYEGRAWEYSALRQHCPFFGLIFPKKEGEGEGEGEDGWRPPAEADQVREGLGLAPFPFGIRATVEGEERKAIEALIRDWQFLESLGMGPIDLVGVDELEEEEREEKEKEKREEGERKE